MGPFAARTRLTFEPIRAVRTDFAMALGVEAFEAEAPVAESEMQAWKVREQYLGFCKSGRRRHVS